MDPRLPAYKRSLDAAFAALSGGRPRDAAMALHQAYPLLAQSVAAGADFSAIVNIQAANASLDAGDPDLAGQYVCLVVHEIGIELERLGREYLAQLDRGDRDEARRTEIRAYTLAVTFIPQVKRARLCNLLAGDPALAGDPMVPAIDHIQKYIRPRLDAARWDTWTCDEKSARRARWWAAFAVTRWANTLFDNLDSGEDVECAQELFESATILLEGFAPDRLRCDSWSLAGRIAHAYGSAHYGDAIRWYRQAIRVEDELGLRAEAARDRANLGAVHFGMAEAAAAEGHPDAEEVHLRDAMRALETARDGLRDPLDSEGLIGALVNLAALYDRVDRWPDACSAFEEAWRYAPDTASQAPVHQARIAANYGAQLYAHRQLPGAEDWLRRAVAAGEQFAAPEPRFYVLALGTLGRLLTEDGRLDEGHVHLARAVTQLEAYRTSFRAERSAFELMKTLGWVYEALIRCCAESSAAHPERAAEAFELAEKTKWRILTVTLRYLPLGILDPEQEPLVEEEARVLGVARAALREPAVAASEPVMRAFRRLDEIWNDMQPRHPEYVAFRRQQTVTAAAAVKLLDAEVSVLLEYYFGDDYGTALAFVLRSDQPVPVVVPLAVNMQQLAAKIAELRAKTTKTPSAAFTKIAAELYDILIRPVQLYVPEGAGVCIVPYGPLHNLPFSGLFDGSRYLIERNALVVAPTAGALRWWAQKNPRQAASCLLFTATSASWVGTQKLPDLVLFESLAQDRIAPLFARKQFIGGEDAQKARFIDELTLDSGRRWDVVHVACHGVFPDAQGPDAGRVALNAFLAMAGPSGGENDLKVIDIMTQLRCRTTLVTLSACHSGVSQATAGDEMAGLTHAFLMAGASSVLSSLCYVVQDAGVALTETFYREWRTGTTKIKALQMAQQRALRRRKWFGLGGREYHPQQWSAFQLSGDWR